MITSKKSIEREEIERLTKEFLKKGGKIKVSKAVEIPPKSLKARVVE